MQSFDINFRIRQSTLELAACLFRFKRHEIDGLPRPDTTPTVRGTTFHDGAREYVRHLVETDQSTDMQYGSEIAKRMRDVDASQLLDNWVAKRSFNTDAIYDTEIPITLDWNFKPVPPSTLPKDGPFHGTIDRLEIFGDEADIFDYKTSWGIFSPNTIQSFFYPWLLSKLLPHLKKIRFHLDFVRWNVLKPREFTAEEIAAKDQEIEILTLRLMDALRTNTWPAIVNDFCFNCTLQCPLVEAGMTREGIRQIQTQEQAIEMAQELYALENKSKQFKSALRNYVIDQGPIEILHHRLGFRKRTRKTFQAKKVLALNDQYGFETGRALAADSTEVKKIGKKYPEYVQELEKTAKDDSTSEFTFMTLDPEIDAAQAEILWPDESAW